LRPHSGVLALIERCNKLRDGGRIEQARKLFKEVERLNERPLRLEDVKPRERKPH